MSAMRLAVHDASPARVESIRGRCLDALAARRGRGDAGHVVALRAWVETAAAAALGALFLAEAVARSLTFLR